MLINSSLPSLLIFVMSFYSLHETLHHEIAKYQSRFYWAGEGDKQKYHMVSWPDICKPRDQHMNTALLTKWVWRIANGDGGLWLDIIRNKYLRGQPLAFCQRSGGSQFWQSVIQLLPVLRIDSSISIGSRSATLFWLDHSASELSFIARFPVLFATTVESRTSVEVALRDLVRLVFRRPFGPPKLAAWDDMPQCIIALNSPNVDTTTDHVSWGLEPSARFFARSLYRAIVPSFAQEAPCENQDIHVAMHPGPGSLWGGGA
ncbi:ABC transporter G family member 37 [Hordeum vulgare]|nr:ABC transporter G family member 37 [Hordeum vulgare]